MAPHGKKGGKQTIEKMSGMFVFLFFSYFFRYSPQYFAFLTFKKPNINIFSIKMIQVFLHIFPERAIINEVCLKKALLTFKEGFCIMKKVGIIMGSDSDLPIIRKATDMLSLLEIPFEVHVYSAHRTPDEARDFARSARDNGFGVLIAAAGMAAHLAGAVAANTTLPVIGIPCKSSVLDGMDALLSTVMMPSGIPVATVAINGGQNAALLAAQILALSDDALAARLDKKRRDDAENVLKKDAAVSAEFQ